MEILIIFIGLLILLFMVAVPVGIAIGLTCMAVLWIMNDFGTIQLTLFPLKMMHGINNFPMLAIPFFILAANAMNKGSVTHRIFDLANGVVGHFRGGLGHVNVIASMIFAGMSGTASADAAGLGALEIKAMRERGYPISYSTGITGASSVIGPIIPPSVAMVIYGWLGDVSVGKLFIAGVIPGVLFGVSLMVMTWLMSFKIDMPIESRKPVKEIFRLSKRAVLALLTPSIIVGGIWSGVFTPTESGAVASAYAIILGMFIYKDVTPGDLKDIFYSTIEFTAIILFIISMSVLYGWLLVRLQIPLKLSEMVTHLSTNQTVLMLVIVAFLLLIGCFMSVIEAVLIFTPVMVPMIKTIGIDPLYFGVIMVISLSVGVITPPFGNVLYILVGITETSFEEVVKAILPFFIPIIVIIILFIFFPEIVTFLPRILY
ncbi:MAG: TRAP transporter large permease [Calditrichaeota bacterium]|nr:TRAP transporter large permease [Calditrichota bacterium]